MIKLTINGNTLRATAEHPFYVVEKNAWVKAQDLRIGDHLKSISGGSVRLDNTELEQGKVPVYNLDVRGNHNYYACDVLVHNCDMLEGLPDRPAVTDNTGASAAAKAKQLEADDPAIIPSYVPDAILTAGVALALRPIVASASTGLSIVKTIQTDSITEKVANSETGGSTPIKYGNLEKITGQMKQRAWTEQQIGEGFKYE